MNKELIFEEIVDALERQRLQARDAVTQAHETATHEENIAENKYDTLGLEAAYLAHGLAVREEQCQEDINAFNALSQLIKAEHDTVKLGALIEAVDEKDFTHIFFYGPAAGGLKVTDRSGNSCVVITASSPMGKALSGNSVGDEVEVSIGDTKMLYEITRVL